VARIEFDLIVIDEASMVGDTIFEDLKSYGIPIAAVGDHGQLPPIASKYNLMEHPMVRLEKIHRQAEGNPIIHWSMLARQGEKIPFEYLTDGRGHGALKTQTSPMELLKVHAVHVLDYMVLCGINRTRVELNKGVRLMLGRVASLEIGEKVICLKNNRHEKIFNGMVGRITKIEALGQDFYQVAVKFDLMGFEWSGQIFKDQFNQEYTVKDHPKYGYEDIGNLFDFGYAMTVHKSQGSQAETVMLVEERMRSMTDDQFNRWLYTGITRASKNLIIVSKS
jgi:exodeoxyribonuclease-5